MIYLHDIMIQLLKLYLLRILVFKKQYSRKKENTKVNIQYDSNYINKKYKHRDRAVMKSIKMLPKAIFEFYILILFNVFQIFYYILVNKKLVSVQHLKLQNQSFMMLQIIRHTLPHVFFEMRLIHSDSGTAKPPPSPPPQLQQANYAVTAQIFLTTFSRFKGSYTGLF